VSSVREQALSKLETVLNTTSVQTVVRALQGLDLTRYGYDDLPLLEIVADDETARYEVSRYALWTLEALATLYFLADTAEQSTVESYAKELKDAIGNNPTLDNVVEMVFIDAIEVGGEFPLYWVRLRLRILYEKSIKDA